LNLILNKSLLNQRFNRGHFIHKFHSALLSLGSLFLQLTKIL